MELTKFYDGARYDIVYGEYKGPEKRAIELLYETLCEFVPYIPEMYEGKPSSPNIPIFIGTKSSNPSVAEKLSSINLSEDEIYYKVADEYIIISGGSALSVFYAACSFCDDYLPKARRRTLGHPFFVKPFIDKMPEAEHRSSPAVKERGLWTWGHVIYDYKTYIKNLARLKMNKITIWNDCPPLNAREIVDYAHSFGVKVFWGYSWGWDEHLDIRSEELMRQWGKAAVDSYKNGYADTGCDGIYYQMFTEQKTDTQDGVNIAEYAVKWTNYIASEIYKLYPDLKIEFGLHATSVKNHLDKIAKTDDRIYIVWEDCGAFPYHYNAFDTADYDETLAFSEKIAALREGKRFGAVLKGASWLDWSCFAHQKTPFILGMNGEREIAEKATLRRDIYRYQESAWLQNGEKAYSVIKLLAEKTKGDCTLSDLVEDGLFDRHIYLPNALFAEMCWDVASPYDEILRRVSARTYIDQ